jgi:hydroxyethylthiazole kinase
MNYAKTAGELLAKVRKVHPLLHHITNYVVMNDCANMALHIGGSPVMAHAHNEMEEMTGIASALVINIGTLDNEWIEGMKVAAKKASTRGIPIILDPVGAGATKLRTQTALNFLNNYPVGVLKGNLGEISVLAGLGGEVRGVDSASGGAEAKICAVEAADKFNTVVAVTGKEDYISDGKTTLCVSNGHKWLSAITGSGCCAGTVVSAFCAVGDNLVTASACGLAVYGIASEIAAQNANGPASFRTAFFDTVYNLTPEIVEKHARIENA